MYHFFHTSYNSNTPASVDTSFSFVPSFSLLSHFCLFVRGGDDILALVDISPFRFLAALHFFCLVLTFAAVY